MSSAAPPGGAGSSGGDYLLDSSVLIPSLRGDTAISARIDSLPQVYVSSIVLGELYFGAFGSPTRPADALSDIQGVEQNATILAADATTALIYGRIGQDLKGKHLTMPENDVWIAATAIQYDLTLAARDAHFNWIAGLRVEQW